MAYKLIKEEYCAYANAQIREYICDTDEDFASLPACCTGSSAVSIATGAVQVVNTSGQWVPFGGE